MAKAEKIDLTSVLNGGVSATTSDAPAAVNGKTVATIVAFKGEVVYRLNGVTVHTAKGAQGTKAEELLGMLHANSGGLNVRIGARDHKTDRRNPKVFYGIADKVQGELGQPTAEVYGQLFGLPTAKAKAFGDACAFGFWNVSIVQGGGQKALRWTWDNDQELGSAEAIALYAERPRDDRRDTGGRR